MSFEKKLRLFSVFKKKKGKEVVLKIQGMYCSTCIMEIDGRLEETDGIQRSETNYVKSETRVEFDEKVISHKTITAIVKDLGYDASLAD